MDPASALISFGLPGVEPRVAFRTQTGTASPGRPEPELVPHMRCSAHGRTLLGLCEECDEPVCSACACCVKRHSIAPLAAVVAAEFPVPPDAVRMHKLAAVARRHTRGMRAAAASAWRDAQCAERDAERHADAIACLQWKRVELEKQRKHAGDVLDEKQAQQIAKDVERVDKAQNHYNAARAAARTSAACAYSTAAAARDAFARVEFTASLTQFPHDAAGRAALALATRACRAAPRVDGLTLGVPALAALAGAHARVEAALAGRIGAQLPCLPAPTRTAAAEQQAAARACAAALEAAARLGACTSGGLAAEACVREAAALLGAELAPPSMPGPVGDEDASLAAGLARAGLADAVGAAGEAQLALDRMLTAWPPRAARTGEDYAVHAGVSERARTPLAAFARTARTPAMHQALSAIARVPAVPEPAEAAARAAAETTHVAAAHAAADRAGELQARADAFAAIARLKGLPADEHTRRLVWAVLDAPRSPATSVRAFNAFRGARNMPEVQAALATKLEDAGPLRVARGARLAWLPRWKGETLITSLAACGVLCMGGYTEDNSLVVAHLPTKRTIQITYEEGWAHGFVHGRELFVAQAGHSVLWHAPVVEVLAGRTHLAEFVQMPLVAKWGSSSCLDAAAAGWVVAGVYLSPTQHLVVDLAARTSRLVNVGQELPSLGGFAGIAVPGAEWTASTDKWGSANSVFVVSPDGATRQIADGMYERPTVLPSASCPTDMACAAVLDTNANLSVGGVKGQLRRPVRPTYQSLVRLYRDVFLCWNKNTRAWATARIVVP